MTANESSLAKRATKTQRGPHAPRHIVIEGPLRVGKSTLARILAERLHARRVYDCEDNPFLGDFYKEEPGSALRVQMYFLMERQRRLREGCGGFSRAVAFRFPDGEGPDFANLNLDDEELETLRAILRSASQGYSPAGFGDLFAGEAGSLADTHCEKSDQGRKPNLDRIYRRGLAGLRTFLFPVRGVGPAGD